MNPSSLPERLEGRRMHLVGAKGTGMCALAEILFAARVRLSGSDVPETFYTDAILKDMGFPLFDTFEAAHVDSGIDFVIHSSAYKREMNPELIEADRLGIPVLLYTEALGSLSLRYDSSGISGVHGKTTTTAIAGTLLKKAGCPATILAGSAVSNFGGHSTLVLGNEFFVAETCEYQRHFLSFKPRRIVITSIEPDHQDYYPTYEDILSAFVEYGSSLPEAGELIYCADDPGAVEASDIIGRKRPDITRTPYGKAAEGGFRLERYDIGNGIASFKLAGFDEPFGIRIPGRHIALDACAALALSCSIIKAELSLKSPFDLPPGRLEGLRRGLESFHGSKRRSEILGEASGILFMDDYGHHPTAIARTLEGLSEFHPTRRIVIDFMAHTYSRTKALFREFASCFACADELVLHKIYPSAREAFDPTVTGRDLFEACGRNGVKAAYFEEPMEAVPYLEGFLKKGDLFITMGAGDNWRVGEALLEHFRAKDGVAL